MTIHLCRDFPTLVSASSPGTNMYALSIFMTHVLGFGIVGSTNFPLESSSYRIAQGLAGDQTASINLGAGQEYRVLIPTGSHTVSDSDIDRILVLKSNDNPRKNSGLFRVISASVDANTLEVDYRTNDVPPAEDGMTWRLYESENTVSGTWSSGSTGLERYNSHRSASCSRVILRNPKELNDWSVRLCMESDVDISGAVPVGMTVAPGWLNLEPSEHHLRGDFTNDDYHTHGAMWFDTTGSVYRGSAVGIGVLNGGLWTDGQWRITIVGDDDRGTVLMANRSGTLPTTNDALVVFGLPDDEEEDIEFRTDEGNVKARRLFVFGTAFEGNHLTWRQGFQNESLPQGMSWGVCGSPVPAVMSSYADIRNVSTPARAASGRDDSVFTSTTELLDVEVIAGTLDVCQAWDDDPLFHFEPRRLGVLPLAKQGRTNFDEWTVTNDIDLSLTPTASLLVTEFDGVDDQAIAPFDHGHLAANNPYFDFSADEAFSISVWFKVEVPGTNTLVSKYDNAAFPFGWRYEVNAAGQVRVEMVYAGGTELDVQTTAVGFDNGQWHHAVLTYDGSRDTGGIHIYADDIDQPLTINTNNFPSFDMKSNAVFMIGARDFPANTFNGLIDEVSIHGRELTLSEASTIYNLGRPTELLTDGPRDALIGYWKMGDGDTHPWLTNRANIPYSPLTKCVLLNPHFTLSSRAEDRIQFGNEPEFDFDVNDPFTVGFWIKDHPGIWKQGLVISKTRKTSSTKLRGWEVVVHRTSIAFTLWFNTETLSDPSSTSRTYSSGRLPGDGRWRLIVCTHAGGAGNDDGQVYMDGVNVRQSISGGPPGAGRDMGPNIAQLELGGRTGDWTDDSGVKMCHAFIYNRKLEAREAQALYGRGVPQDLSVVGPTGSLVWWAPLGDGDGLGTDNVRDISGNGLHGTATAEVTDSQFFLDAPTGPMLEDRSANNNHGHCRLTPSPYSNSPIFRGYLLPWGGFGNDEAIADLSGYRNQADRNTNVEDTDLYELPPGGLGSASYTQYARLAGIDFGDRDNFVMGDIDELRFSITSSFSVQAWARTTTSEMSFGSQNHFGMLISKQFNAGSQRGWHLAMNHSGWLGRFALELAVDTGTSNYIRRASSSGYNDGAWHHVIATYDGSATAAGVKFYVDGSGPQGVTIRDTLTGEITSSAQACITGRDGAATTFSGWTTEFVVWNRELTFSESVELYNSGDPIDPRITTVGSGGIVGYWRDANITAGGASRECAVLGRETSDADYITMQNAPELDFERTETFSLCAWFKAEPGSDGYLISKIQSTGGRGYGLVLQGTGSIRFLLSHDSSTNIDAIDTTDNTWADGNWHQVIATNAGTGIAGMLIYIDANLQAVSSSTTLGSNTISNDGPFNIGGRTNGTFLLDAAIDNVAVYNTVVSAADVVDLFNELKPVDHTVAGPTGSLVGYWDMQTFTPGVNNLEMTSDMTSSFSSDSPGKVFLNSWLHTRDGVYIKWGGPPMSGTLRDSNFTCLTGSSLEEGTGIAMLEANNPGSDPFTETIDRTRDFDATRYRKTYSYNRQEPRWLSVQKQGSNPTKP